LHDFSPVLDFNLSAFRRACKFAQQVWRHGGTIDDSARFLPTSREKPAYPSITDRHFGPGRFLLWRPINRLPPPFPPRKTQREKFSAATRDAPGGARGVC
jgi:hypothetical protein